MHDYTITYYMDKDKYKITGMFKGRLNTLSVASVFYVEATGPSEAYKKAEHHLKYIHKVLYKGE